MKSLFFSVLISESYYIAVLSPRVMLCTCTSFIYNVICGQFNRDFHLYTTFLVVVSEHGIPIVVVYGLLPTTKRLSLFTS